MTRKIAVVTDVHGNSAALRAVLEDIDKQSDVEHIYCLGDMVAIGHETNEVLKLLFSREDVSMVTGNHEDDVLAIYQDRPAKLSGGVLGHHKWIVSHTERAFFPKLLSLPRFLEVEYDRHHILMVHYHLNKARDFLPIDANPSSEKLDKIYDGTPYDMVCFGHHHPVHFYESARRTYLNPGALGCCERPVARYGILYINDGIEVQLKEIEYDNQEFLDAYEKLKVPERDFILKVFHGNQHRRES